jgi:hypothetical protein
MAYWVCTNGSPVQSVVHYALSTDSGATWTIEAVDTSSNYGTGECQMAWFRGGLDLDMAGRPHVAYTVSAPGTGSFCIHAVRMGPNDWRRDTVEMSSNALLICYDADLKIDRQNRAHVAYLYNGYEPRYAVQDGDSWELHDVEGDSTVGVALALDSIDNPHIAAGGIGSVRYNYSSDGGESWLSEVVSGAWWHCDIALGANDEPLLVHSVGSIGTSNVWLSHRSGPGSWTHVQVDDGANNPYRPAVFYDRGDSTIHVAYYGGSQLKQSRSTDNGLTWLKENVTSASMCGTANVPDYVRSDPGVFLPFEGPSFVVAVARDLSQSGIAERPTVDPTRLSLSVCPTPCTDATTITCSLPGPGHIRLKLYDFTGSLVRVLASGHYSAGLHSVVVSSFESGVSRLGRGVYLLRLETASGSITRKLVLE